MEKYYENGFCIPDLRNKHQCYFGFSEDYDRFIKYWDGNILKSLDISQAFYSDDKPVEEPCMIDIQEEEIGNDGLFELVGRIWLGHWEDIKLTGIAEIDKRT